MSTEEYTTIKDASRRAKVTRSAMVEWIARGFLDQDTMLDKLVVRIDQLEALIDFRLKHQDDWRRTWKQEKAKRFGKGM